MALLYILTQVGNKIGLNPSNVGDRNVLLRFVNEACPELYNQSDMAGSLREQIFKCNGDQTIALPSYVGQIRAIREMDSQIAWHINQLRPRYNQSNWPDMWRNFRLKGLFPLQVSIRNQSIITVSVDEVEDPPIVVSITGSTSTSSSVSEQLTMSTTFVNTVNQFLDVSAIKKDRVNGFDVGIFDVDERLLTTIPNNVLQAQYQIIDVSLAPWLNQDTGKLDHYVEILYKQALPWFQNDDDEFPALGYDNVIVNKVLQLWYEEQGNPTLAAAYDSKATRSLARIHEDANRATEDVVALVENPHDMLSPRQRANRPTRYGDSRMCGKYGYM
jgi:hypothetical protein